MLLTRRTCLAPTPDARMLPRAHARNHLLHMCNGRLRQDAMSKIEDERPAGKGFKYRIDHAIEWSAASEQHHRIEIPLHRHTGMDLIPNENGIDRPIKADRIHGNILHVG